MIGLDKCFEFFIIESSVNYAFLAYNKTMEIEEEINKNNNIDNFSQIWKNSKKSPDIISDFYSFYSKKIEKM